MSKKNRFHYLALAVVLAFGVMVLAGHSTLHSQSGVEQCLMCASHADPGSTMVFQAGYVAVHISSKMETDEYSERFPVIDIDLTFQARAPPISI
ncbi:MAG: hypothetical protein ACI9H8_000161 [Lysobacterales bacterium]|jgi:hypothetical protein